MKVKFMGNAPSMSYILGVVEPGKIYNIDKKNGIELCTGNFIEVKEVKKEIKKDGD